MDDVVGGEAGVVSAPTLLVEAAELLVAGRADAWALNTNSLTVAGNEDKGIATFAWLATLSKATSAVGPSAIRAGYCVLLSSPLPVAVGVRIDDKLSDVMESALIWFMFVAYQRLCQGSNSRN